MTQILVRLGAAGGYVLAPSPAPGATVRVQMENELVVLVTRLNSAGDGLFAQSQDTFVVEPSNWGSTSWDVGDDASRATRITAALGSAGDRSQWYLIAVDKTVPGVDVDETAQRFVYGSPAPPTPPVPPPPSQVTGVRVSPLDGGLRVSWSAAAGPVDVSQYRVDVADAAGERVRRVYTEADVFEAVVDGLANGVEYTVTVSALPGHGGENGPPSEPRTATPGADGEPDVPVSALPSQVTGVRVSPLDGGLRVSWNAAAGPVDVSQYRVDVADAAGELVRRVHTEAGVLEAVVDGLVNGVEYTVTVSVLTADVEGPPSEPRTATPRAGDEPDVPVAALPLAGAGVLAGLLASAAYRFQSAGRRASGGGRRRRGSE